jgi:CheY-like chemotaxis protein
MAHRESTSILLAEDDENDVLMFRRASGKANFNNPIHVVSDGEEVISYLSGAGAYANRRRYPTPGLLLLDLKMPGKSGFEVLQWIRGQAHLALLQVVVLSSSEQIQDINRAYALGANSFLVKPVFFSEFVGMLEALHSYCLRVWQQQARLRATTPAQPAAVGI